MSRKNAINHNGEQTILSSAAIAAIVASLERSLRKDYSDQFVPNEERVDGRKPQDHRDRKRLSRRKHTLECFEALADVYFVRPARAPGEHLGFWRQRRLAWFHAMLAQAKLMNPELYEIAHEASYARERRGRTVV